MIPRQIRNYEGKHCRQEEKRGETIDREKSWKLRPGLLGSDGESFRLTLLLSSLLPPVIRDS